VISRDQSLHAGSDLLHDASTLMTTDMRDGQWHIALNSVVVGMAEARGLNPD
jgi:hypothetical protein